MAERAAAASEEEIVPIRVAGGNTGRNYNTTTSSQIDLRHDQEPDTTGAADVSSTPTATSSAPVNTQPVPTSSSTEANGHDEHAGPSKRKRSAWVKDVAERFGSISLENKGSVARDHLALERTFLAWLRTSLAFASIGIAITQLFRLNTSLSRQVRMSTVIEPAVVTELPFSPYVGHSIPADLAPYLQNVLASGKPSPTPSLGPTLFDQLFKLTADGKRIPGYDASYASSLNELHSTDTTNSKIKHLGKPLGATFIGVSIMILLVGFHRYFESQYWIIKGKFPASRGSVAFVGLVTAALIISCLVVIVVVDPTSYERKKR